MEACAIGFYFEDQVVGGRGLLAVDVQAKRILEMGAAAAAAVVPVFINARTDAFLQSPGDRFGSWSLVGLLRSMMPTLEEAGIVTAESIGLDTLEERLVAEVESVRGVGRGPLVFGAWGVVPA